MMKISTPYWHYNLDNRFSFRMKDRETGEVTRQEGILLFSWDKTRFGKEKKRRYYLMLRLKHSHRIVTGLLTSCNETLWRVPMEEIERLYAYDGFMLTKEEMAKSIIRNYPLDFGKSPTKSDSLHFTPAVRRKLSEELERGITEWLTDSDWY